MGKPLSSSERRGLLWVAGAALLVIFAGILTSRCDSTPDNPVREEIVIRPETDSLSDSSDTREKRVLNGGSRKRARRKAARRSAPKEYRRRDPRHEPVDSILQ